MDKLPSTIIQHIYEYDRTYNDEFDKVLLQMKMLCCVYRCSECFKSF